MRIFNPAGREGQQSRDMAGSIPPSDLRTLTAGSYSLIDSDATVLCSTMRGAVTLTLPRAVTCSGRQVTVRKADAGQGTVTIQSANGETVDGQTWVSLTAQNEFVTLLSDGHVWKTGLHF
jgi:hypothetical protein